MIQPFVIISMKVCIIHSAAFEMTSASADIQVLNVGIAFEVKKKTSLYEVLIDHLVPSFIK